MRALAHYSFMHRRAVVVIAVLCSVAAAVYGVGVFDRAEPFGFSDPDSESSRAYDRLEDATGEQAVPGVLLVVRPAAGADSAAGHTEVAGVARRLAHIEGIASVDGGSAGGLVSDDGTLALVTGALESSVEDVSDVGERVTTSFDGRGNIDVGGLAVAATQLNETTEEDLRTIELFAAPFLLLISLLVFRSVVAAMLPLIVGGLSIAFTLAAMRAMSEVMEIDIFALNVVTVLGLGLAIDYSLFMVSRYREEIAQSGAGGPALGRTLVPVGRMVCFSAAIVAAAVASLAVFPQRFLYSTGVGCAIVALVSAAVVIFVLPAILAVLGERVNALGLRDLRRPAGVSNRWRRVAALVTGRPGLIAIAVAAIMVVAGLPFLRVELTRADARVLPEDNSARLVDQTIRERFSNDPSASILVVLPEADPTEVAAAQAKLQSLDGVISTARVRRGSDPEAIWARIRPSPYADEALDLVSDVRAIAVGEMLVAGTSAELVDQRESIREHLPLAVAIILATTVLALLLMTGSVVLPLLTVIANTLTISVAFGILVLIFQDGRLEGPLAYADVGALDISVPILLFAVVFGLSTDYGVFLLSRIAEARGGGAGDSESIALGLERSGRIITAAALLFAVAMGAFVFSQMIFIKEVAVGTAIAVLVDAALVRTLLLPAMMLLCGRWTWWSPGPPKRLARLRA